VGGGGAVELAGEGTEEAMTVAVLGLQAEAGVEVEVVWIVRERGRRDGGVGVGVIDRGGVLYIATGAAPRVPWMVEVGGLGAGAGAAAGSSTVAPEEILLPFIVIPALLP
jgi:hypothetical protein